MAILQDLLMPSFVRDRISRVFTPSRYLSRSFGFNLGGPNVSTVKGRVYTYDIYDNVRTVSNARSPHSPAGTIAANPVGNNTVTLGTFKEKLPLDYNQLLQIRRIGEGASDLDVMGAKYIELQVATLKQRSENAREFITGALLGNGGKYGYFFNGDDWVPTFDVANANMTVDCKIYTENVLDTGGGAFAAGMPMGTGTNTLTATWATASTNIPVQLDAISSAFQDLVGAPLDRIYCGTDVWRNVINNDYVRQIAGTANISAEFDQEPDVGPDGQKTGLIKCVLKAMPWVSWYVWDGSLRLAATNGTTFSNVKMLKRKYATFMVDPNVAPWMRAVEGSEIIKDNDLAPPVERYGYYAWAMEKADPARVWYHTLQVLGLELNMPKGIAWGQVQ
jgi:hypothetical protein